MERINPAQLIIIRIAGAFLLAATFYNTYQSINTLINYWEYVFNSGIYYNIGNVVWLITLPLYLLLSIGIMIFCIMKKDALLIKLLIAYLAMHVLISILNFVLNILSYKSDFSWIPEYVGHYLFGWSGFLNHFFTITGNLATACLAVALLIGLLSKKEFSSQIPAPVAFDAPNAHQVAPIKSANPTGDLAELVKMFEAGHLNDAEFKAAKKKILE